VSEERLVKLIIDNQVATLTLNRPKQLNALNQAVLHELDERLDEIAQSDARVVLLQGEGRAFAAGADISQMQSFTPQEGEAFALYGQRVFSKFERLPQPTVALVHGFALGGGMELAMACDIRIAAAGTKFGQPEVTLGVIPGFGGSQRLPRIVGQGRALSLLLTGELIDADEAYRIGLVTKVVPQEELQAAGSAVVEQLLRMGPIALQYVKRAVYEGAELDLDKGLSYEASLFGLCFATSDQTEGMKAFLEKRKPTFEGR
jgi:enoyl-CoA hydratase/carnithine racemase